MNLYKDGKSWFNCSADQSANLLRKGWIELINTPPKYDEMTQCIEDMGIIITGDKAVQQYKINDLSFQNKLDRTRQKRATEYPSLGDQLDALYKSRKGDDSDLLSIDAKILAVKSKYPKPNA